MSNIYINEPPTSGKILLKTTVGDIDIELWCKETPKTCRNIIQLAMEGYYDNCEFFRVVKGFIVQTGDPSNSGFGGESIYDGPFKDEFHSRLRFERRGLVAMANAGKDDNLSQFFFTMGPTQELQNKHTIFGKVTGNTIYNMLKLQETSVDKNERPLHPHRIISAEILKNPFDDIQPRERKEKKKQEDEAPQVHYEKPKPAKKDYKLLSFGDEAEEEDEEIESAIKQELQSKPKSSHDLIKDDPALSSAPAVSSKAADKQQPEGYNKSKKKCSKSASPSSNSNSDNDKDLSHKLKTKKSKQEQTLKQQPNEKCSDNEQAYDDDDIYSEKRKEIEEAQQKIKLLKKELLSDETSTSKTLTKKPARISAEDREKKTLDLLAQFKNKIKSGEGWLSHKLVSNPEDEGPTLAKDANLKDQSDWYEIHDPRSSITKHRRDATSSSSKKKIKSTKD